VIEIALTTILWPALTGGAILLLGVVVAWTISRPHARDGEPEAGGSNSHPWSLWPMMLAGAVAMTVTFIVSFRYTEGEWPFPPLSRWHWMFPMALAGGAIGVINSLVPTRAVPGWLRISVVGGLLALASAMLFRPLPPAGDEATFPPWLWNIGIGLTVLIAWLGIEGIARRERDGWLLFGLIAAFTAASFVIVESRFAKPAQLAGAMAAFCGIALAISVILTFARQRLPAQCGMIAPLAVILPALLMYGWIYSSGNVPAISFLAAGAGPLPLLLASMPLCRRWSGWRGWVLRAILIVILPVIAVVLTMLREDPPEPRGYEW